MAVVDQKDKDTPLEKGGDNDCSTGPVKKRGCTDVICLGVFIFHWVLWFMLLIWAFTAGNPARLTAQRDFKGAYCGHDGNNDGHMAERNTWRFDRTGYDKGIFTMNVDAQMNEQLAGIVCSQLSGMSLQAGLGVVTQAELDDFSSGCSPGAQAEAALAAMKARADPANAAKGGTSFMSEMDKFFHKSCVTSCSSVSKWAAFEDYLGLVAWAGVKRFLSDTPPKDMRAYQYHPPPNDNLYKPTAVLWKIANEDTTGASAARQVYQNTVRLALSAMSFPALPESMCKEVPQYCVPLPGLEYTDMANFCMMKLSSGAMEAAGAAADAAGGQLSAGLAAANSGDISNAIGDITIAWPVFIIMFFLSLIIGFAFMVALRFAVGIMVWGALIVVLSLLVGGGGYYYFLSTCETKTVAEQSGTISIDVTEDPPNTTSVITTGVTYPATSFEECQEPDEATRDQYKVFAYIFFVMAGIYLFLLLCNLSRIQLGIAINKVAARFMYQTKTILFVPVVQMGVCCIWWMIWLIGAMYVLSSVDPEGNAFVGKTATGPFTQEDADGTFFVPGKCNSNYPPGASYVDEFTGYWLTGEAGTDTRADDIHPGNFYYHMSDAEDTCKKGSDNCYRCILPRLNLVTVQFAFYFFSLLWNNAFIVAVGQCTVAGSVAIWYFTPNSEKGAKSSVRPAFYNCFRYHLGSLAVGSFILAVVQFIKWVLRYIQKQAEQQKNYILAKIAAGLACCVQCFERFIKFLNKNAYIQIAILGKNFCRSAWAAFCLILRNMGRIGVLATIGSGVNVIGVAFITGMTVFLGYFITLGMYEDDISSPIMCCVLIFMIGFMVGKLFMTVFALAVDTTLQCFCADEELNKGGNDYTPEELKGFLKDPNKKRGCCG